jgi:single-strand DNA-binding protein
MNEPVTTMVGNLVDAPEVRFTPTGKAVCKFRLACTPRRREGDDWKDGTTLWINVTAWAPFAENIADSNLTKGMQLVVMGTLEQRDWEHEGQKRSAIEMTAQAIGVSLQFATATPEKAKRSGGGGGGRGPDPWAGTDATPAGNGRPAGPPANADQARTAQAAQATVGATEPSTPW